ncbi:LrgB family protein [Caldalkalibacillus mannanilyticus]|uniref:LrgB family protein n=1 Tax=Caldalkalibacillus mannanilyticus TaxID=1418 RepID=UPI00068696BE|nr:LrgB family protein [Caldalkalibacillus mannanilyticus]
MVLAPLISQLSLVQSPLFGVALTVGLYVICLFFYQKLRWLHPVVFTSLFVLFILVVADIPYENYQLGGDLIFFFLGPATVALAVPLYKNYLLIREHFWSILIGILAGCLTGMFSAYLIVWLLGGSREMFLALASKTVTTPIAVEMVQGWGGAPQLIGVLTVLTGIIGSVCGPKLLKLCGISDDIAYATAIGTSAHGIGTARLLLDSERRGGVSGFAMGLTGIVMPLFMVLLTFYL